MRAPRARLLSLLLLLHSTGSAFAANAMTGPEAERRVTELYKLGTSGVLPYEEDQRYVPVIKFSAAGKMPLARIYAMADEDGELLKQPTEEGVHVVALWVQDLRGTTIFLHEFEENETPNSGFAVPQSFASSHVELRPYALTSENYIYHGAIAMPGRDPAVRKTYGIDPEFKTEL